MKRLRAGSKLGKYRIVRVLGTGGFATVYQAADAIEGVAVALKVPHPHMLSAEVEGSLGKEIRIAARLEHANVLTPKNAMMVDGRLVIAYPMGRETLADRMSRRMSTSRAAELARQMIAGLAHAHANRIIHCDIKPENFIIFDDDVVRLTDFGISKTAARTLQASGSGTVGYMAPEQAMGRPSLRSDVFSMGLVCYQLFAGDLPDWPFERPFPREERVRRKFSPKMLAFFHRAIRVKPARRFADAVAMQDAFEAACDPTRKKSVTTADWRDVRSRQFFTRFAEHFPHRTTCRQCRQPVGESMQFCPWCGVDVEVSHSRSFPRSCDRCGRGVKSDWRFCPWCWGPAIGEVSPRRWPDRRYVARCSKASCREMTIMPFMRYCPRCHEKVRRVWKLNGTRQACDGCGHGVAAEFWDHCAWCGRAVERS